jgi:Kef-type K+ transport system membrane component KefB
MTGELSGPRALADLPVTALPVAALLALTVVLGAARAGGWVATKLRQPPVVGEIVTGILLGPSLLGVLWPDGSNVLFRADVIDALKVIAQLGLVLFMFLVGLDVDLASLRKSGRQAVVISNVSILLPLLLGGGLAVWLFPRFGGSSNEAAFILFIGTAMAITAFPVLARVLQDTGIANTRIGVLSLTCAAVDDITAWCLLTVVLAIAGASGPGRVLVTVGTLLVYVAVMLLVVRPALRRLPQLSVPSAIVLAFASGWVTEQIGVHAIFGAFLAGIVAPRRSAGPLREGLEPLTTMLLLPVFFLIVGLSTRIDLLDSPYLWLVSLLVIVVAVTGKFVGSAITARVIGESWRDAVLLGSLLNMRGLTELVILTVGLSAGIIGPTLYTVMVVMAIVTTVMAAPVIMRLKELGDAR